MIWEARANIEHSFYGKVPYSLKRSMGINFVLVAFTTIVGILVPDIGVLLGLVGSTCSPIVRLRPGGMDNPQLLSHVRVATQMVYILPAAFYLRSGADRRFGGRRWVTAIFVAGCALVLICTTSWVLVEAGAM